MLARINVYVSVHICINSIHILMLMWTREYIHIGIHTHVCKVVSKIHSGYTELCVNLPRKSNLKRFPFYIQIIDFLAAQMAGECVHHRAHSRRMSSKTAWGWFTCTVPSLGRPRQEDGQFKGSLSSMVHRVRKKWWPGGTIQGLRTLAAPAEDPGSQPPQGVHSHL